METTTTGTITQAFCPIKGVWCAHSNGNGCSLTVPCYIGNVTGDVTWGGSQKPAENAMPIERVIELLKRDYWFEDDELKTAKQTAAAILEDKR